MLISGTGGKGHHARRTHDRDLQSTVRAIYAAVSGTLDELKALYPQLTLMLPAEVGFITTQELEDLYPALPPKSARERLSEDA